VPKIINFEVFGRFFDVFSTRFGTVESRIFNTDFLYFHYKMCYRKQRLATKCERKQKQLSAVFGNRFLKEKADLKIRLKNFYFFMFFGL